ncbi:hypothetical protein EOD39_7572 [Acipenser ruthenus]|uniref:Reverse transcriptase RNase H-like domain-containing protein n=1 Tax=Acipenser ruthenus TaxID=7906 RepID=A0A444U6S9_ACIRT|nr:hypothetical protein EOD39_7572 [Acipenser ruthenus]
MSAGACVVTFYSKALGKAKRNYCITRWELLAVIWGVTTLAEEAPFGFPTICEGKEQPIDQWKLLPQLNVPVEQQLSKEYWIKVGGLRNEVGSFLTADLADFMLTVLSLPHDSAEGERLFSQVNLVKTDLHNCLFDSTVEQLHECEFCITTGQEGYTFQPSAEMIQAMNSDIYENSKVEEAEVENEDLDIAVIVNNE